MKQLFLVCIILSLILSCSKDELGPQCVNCEGNPVTSTNTTDVVIVNEGSFGSGSGSLTLYNDSTQTVTQNVFYEVIFWAKRKIMETNI